MTILPLPKEPQGSGSQWFRALRAFVISCRIVDSPDVRANVTSQGTYLRLATQPAGASKPGGGVIKQYRVRSVSNNHLVCREFDGTTEGSTDINVAKPFNLRRDGWSQQTVTYTLEPFPASPGSATVLYAYVTPTYRTGTRNNGVVEHQVIIPRYLPGRSVIFATKVENGTGVATAAEWIDLNADGRAWAEAFA